MQWNDQNGDQYKYITDLEIIYQYRASILHCAFITSATRDTGTWGICQIKAETESPEHPICHCTIITREKSPYMIVEESVIKLTKPRKKEVVCLLSPNVLLHHHHCQQWLSQKLSESPQELHNVAAKLEIERSPSPKLTAVLHLILLYLIMKVTEINSFWVHMITRRVMKQFAFMADTSKYNRKQGKFKRQARYFNKDGLRRISNSHRVKPNQVTKKDVFITECCIWGLDCTIRVFQLFSAECTHTLRVYSHCKHFLINHINSNATYFSMITI